jgi:hypothetical protein
MDELAATRDGESAEPSFADTFCAAIIAEAWSFIHSVEPAPKNREAAAEAGAIG